MKKRVITYTTGFTLVELAVVLVVVALVVGSAAFTSRDILDSANQNATDARLDVIEKALLSFWQVNGRLPCPADGTLANTNSNYGVEASNTLGTCTGGTPAANYASATNSGKAVEGVVPVVTLGLPRQFLVDGWKRKINYAVVSRFTRPGASAKASPQNSCTADTALKITDASGTVRSTSAMYVLISTGINGHGSYPSSGSTRFSASSASTDEQTNCHCTSAAADSTYDGNYVQKDAVMASTAASGYFDDRVRYKERWQMATTEDVLNDAGYYGPSLAVGFAESSTGTVYSYKSTCGGWTKQANLSPAPTQIPRGVAFTAANQHLLTYSALGCNLYKITGGNSMVDLPNAFVTAASVAAPCTYNAAGVMALSDNGYLAVADTTNIKFWKQAGDQFTKLATGNDLVNSNTLIAFSPNANYFAVLPTASGTTIPVYQRLGDGFTTSGFTSPTHSGGATAKNSVAFSPDGRYLAVTSDSNIYLWSISSSGSFTALSTLSPTSSTGLTGVAFSQGGQYLVAGRNETPYFVMYKIDPSDSFTQLSDPSGVPTTSVGTHFSFSANGQYFAMTTDNTSYPVLLFQKTAAMSFEYMSTPFPVGGSPTRPLDSLLSSASGASVAFSY